MDKCQITDAEIIAEIERALKTQEEDEMIVREVRKAVKMMGPKEAKSVRDCLSDVSSYLYVLTDHTQRMTEQLRKINDTLYNLADKIYKEEWWG